MYQVPSVKVIKNCNPLFSTAGLLRVIRALVVIHTKVRACGEVGCDAGTESETSI